MDKMASPAAAEPLREINLMCFICRMALVYDEKEEIVSLNCGHIMHHKCILKWFNLKRHCPYCNKFSVAIHKLFLYNNLTDDNDCRLQVSSTFKFDNNNNNKLNNNDVVNKNNKTKYSKFYGSVYFDNVLTVTHEHFLSKSDIFKKINVPEKIAIYALFEKYPKLNDQFKKNVGIKFSQMVPFKMNYSCLVKKVTYLSFNSEEENLFFELEPSNVEMLRTFYGIGLCQISRIMECLLLNDTICHNLSLIVTMKVWAHALLCYSFPSSSDIRQLENVMYSDFWPNQHLANKLYKLSKSYLKINDVTQICEYGENATILYKPEIFKHFKNRGPAISRSSDGKEILFSVRIHVEPEQPFPSDLHVQSVVFNTKIWSEEIKKQNKIINSNFEFLLNL